MKKILIFSFGIFLTWCLNGQEQIKKSFPSQGISHFAISNISGGIEVIASNTDQIKIVATVESGEIDDEVTIGFKQGTDYLICYLQTPCTKPQSEIEFEPNHNYGMRQWKEDCNWNKGEEEAIPQIKYRVELPANVSVHLNTIMNGDIKVKNMTAEVWASNINGAITLDQVSKVHQAKTVNGDINVNFREAPSVAGEFSTINGDISFKVPPSIRATSSFKTFSGSFYTDLAAIDEMAPSIRKHQDENGFKYKVDNKRQIKFAGGGVQLDFETFNGNVYLTSK